MQEEMPVSQQTAKKFFSLQSRCGLNASRQPECPTKILTSIYKVMKIFFLVESAETTGAWRSADRRFARSWRTRCALLLNARRVVIKRGCALLLSAMRVVIPCAVRGCFPRRRCHVPTLRIRAWRRGIACPSCRSPRRAGRAGR